MNMRSVTPVSQFSEKNCYHIKHTASFIILIPRSFQMQQVRQFTHPKVKRWHWILLSHSSGQHFSDHYTKRNRSFLIFWADGKELESPMIWNCMLVLAKNLWILVQKKSNLLLYQKYGIRLLTAVLLWVQTGDTAVKKLHSFSIE